MVDSARDSFNILNMILNDAGYPCTKTPIYYNHSIKEVALFDRDVDAFFSKEERLLLEYDCSISRIVDLNEDFFEKCDKGATIFTVNFQEDSKFRSQIAYELHSLIRKTLNKSFSIVLFLNNDKVLVSVAGFSNDIVLSDWYNPFDPIEYNFFIELMSAGYMSSNSIYDFYDDLIYSIGRWYYFHPITYEYIRYGCFPESFTLTSINVLKTSIDREDYREIFRNMDIKEYGDDYIPFGDISNKDTLSIENELDLMLVEIDDIEDYEEIDDIEDYDEIEELSEYKNDNIKAIENDMSLIADDTVFDDPIKMVNWLENNTEELEDELDEKDVEIEDEFDSIFVYDKDDKFNSMLDEAYALFGDADWDTVSIDEIVSFFEKNNIETRDNRNKGGALWILEGENISRIIDFFIYIGFDFKYTSRGGKASHYQPAYWYVDE